MSGTVPVGTGPDWLPLLPGAATGARQVDLVLFALVVFAVVLVAVIGTVMLVFLIRYRRGSAADRSGRVDAATRLELTWVAIPTAIALGLFGWAAAVYLDQSTPPEDAYTVYVVGSQWMWKLQHPDGRREIDGLHVPAGRAVKLVLTSEDVIHSFFIPAFRVKQDALPGRYTTLWFEPERIGRYRLLCAEYCGTGHATMGGWVEVMPPAAFAAWLGDDAQAPPGSPGTAEGRMAAGEGAFFRLGCGSCHLPAARVRAPRLDGLFGSEVRLRSGRTVIADEQYVRESILEPQAKIVAGYESPSVMPTYRGQVDEDDLVELVELVRSLQDGWPEEVTP